MNKHLSKIQKVIPDRAVPVLVIIFSLSMLIGGGWYVFAIVTYPLPQVIPSQQLTAAAWNNIVDDINDLNGRVGGSGGGNITCDFINTTQVIGQVDGTPVGCVNCCGTNPHFQCEGGSGCRRTPVTNVSATSDASGNLISITRSTVSGTCVCTGTCVDNSP